MTSVHGPHQEFPLLEIYLIFISYNKDTIEDMNSF